MKKLLLICSAICLSAFAFGQKNEHNGQLHGNFQILAQQYNPDTLIGATVPPATTAINSFGNFNYTNGPVSAGLRFESYNNAIQGYSAQNRYKGTGIGNRYVTYKDSLFAITIGNFYEQFGNGLTLRTYWEPNLGIDNALDGVRLVATPIKGITFKGIYGKQRLDFDSKIIDAEGIIRGGDIEFDFNNFFQKFKDSETHVLIGGSVVSRYQSGGARFVDSLVLTLPNNVAIYSGRFQVNRKRFMMSGEFAHKINDPSADNAFIYRNGTGVYLNASYA
jgi:hypothetical protein